MTTPLIREYMKRMFENDSDPTQIVFFDVSDTSMAKPLDDWKYWIINSRPPFDRCAAIYRGATGKHGDHDLVVLTIGSDPEKGIAVQVSTGRPGATLSNRPALAYSVIDGELKIYNGEKDRPLSNADISAITGCAAIFYQTLAAGIEAYRPEVAPTFTNRRKIAQGKKPSYDWHTVIIEPQKPKSESLGGTHASPRLHDRRGHLRQYKSGKTGWVKACKVGNAALGTVFHDYEVRAA